MRRPALLLALPLAALAGARLAIGDDTPAHPREIRYPELAFDPPAPAKHRLKLANGLTAYLVADPALPVLRVRAYVKTGSVYDPKGKEGLASMVFALLRKGGADEMESEALDDELDKIAASIDGDSSDLRGVVDAWSHARHADRVLELLAAVLRKPKFAQDAFDRTRDDAADEAKNDEDSAGVIAARRVRVACYGAHALARFRSEESLKALSRDDLVAFHRKFFAPGRIVLAVSGAFDEKAMGEKLSELFSDWEAGEKGWAPLLKVSVDENGSGVRLVERPDMSLGYVELGRLGIGAGSADEPALVLADHIFGSGSFTSRISARVRADEGLSYSIDSSFDAPPLVPGLVRVDFQSRASETSYALSLVAEEARKLARDGPSADELQAAKAAVLGRFPGHFVTAADSARALAEADLDGLPDDWYGTFRARIFAVTREDVRAAAARFYDPASLAVVVVGPPACRRSSLHGTSLDDFGPVTIEKPPREGDK
ncbi:insulinase family protein [bacterium]|nr:insulinase family protein [bacterium]